MLLFACFYADLKTFPSAEVNETIDIKNLQCHHIIPVNAYGIENAVRIEVSLLEDLDLNYYERSSDLHVEHDEKISTLYVKTKVHEGLLQKLVDENRYCSVKLDSQLWDKEDGIQLDLKASRLHHINMKKNQANFLQYLVGEKKIESCSRESLSLELKARFYTYSREAL